jgi:hypothetical protein
MAHLSVLDRSRTAPPVSPAVGDRHLVAAGATGLWAGWDQIVAFWIDGAWIRLVPRTGWLVWVAAEAGHLLSGGDQHGHPPSHSFAASRMASHRQAELAQPHGQDRRSLAPSDANWRRPPTPPRNVAVRPGTSAAAPAKLAAEHNRPVRPGAMRLKHVLGQIEADDANLSH